MRSLLIPNSFLHQLQSIFSAYLWSSTKSRSIHWVAWDTTTLPLTRGGLNLKYVRHFYLALASKLTSKLLDLSSPAQPLWCTVLRYKYNFLTGPPPPPHKPSHSPTLSLIQKSFLLLKGQYHFAISGGATTSIWHDPWLWEQVPLISIPTTCPQSLISDLPVSSLINQHRQWNEEACFENLPPHIAQWLIQTLPPQLAGPDRIRWFGNKPFSVRHCYSHMVSQDQALGSPTPLSHLSLANIKLTKKFVPSTARAKAFICNAIVSRGFA